MNTSVRAAGGNLRFARLSVKMVPVCVVLNAMPGNPEDLFLHFSAAAQAELNPRS
jgi:hypothetical protein